MTPSLRQTPRNIFLGIGMMCMVFLFATAFAHASGKFTDVSADHFASEYIEEVADQEIMTGYSDQTFRPDISLNRAELAKIAVLVAKQSGVIEKEKTTGTGASFTDVPEGAWYENYVEMAADAKIFEGYLDSRGNSTGTFGPSDLVTRAQVAKVVLLAANIPLSYPKPYAPFVDLMENDWFVPYVNNAFNYTIIDGYLDENGQPTGYFGTNDFITRGQMAKLVIKSQSPVDKFGGYCFSVETDVVECGSGGQSNTNSASGSLVQ